MTSNIDAFISPSYREDEYRKHVIAVLEAHNEFVNVNGFVYYDPQPGTGALSAQCLRVIADELDRRNDAHDAQLECGICGGFIDDTVDFDGWDHEDYDDSDEEFDMGDGPWNPEDHPAGEDM